MRQDPSDNTLRQELIKRVQIVYPAELPVSRAVDEIKAAIAQHQLIIICGETGSGKTTQLPKILLDMGYASAGLIGHTQPRRLAARSLASRIAQELGIPPTSNESLVGVKMRFHDRTNKATAIKLMTDGILLQEIQSDKLLRQYSALIIDEVHERSLNIDFILGYLQQLLPRRPELKVIITSATLENEKLARFFGGAPLVNVSGKTYPVDIIYQPIDEDNEEGGLNAAIYQAISAALQVERGNGLVFLPGEREIKNCLAYLRKTELNQYELLALFARQNSEAQSLIFNQNGRLKIILATNIAETSLTIPGIKFVIDSGIARVKRYSLRNRVEQLQIENISQASSKQRSGRAGRLSHGLCVRLFSEQEFKLRPAFSEPELLRSNLANVILRLLSLNLGAPDSFPFLDQPEGKAFNDGFRTLFQVGAIDDNNRITALGRKLAHIPLDVQLGRILVAAGEQFACLHEALVITSFLAIQDPREFPLEHQQLVRERHSIWADKQSEFQQILKLWAWYHEQLQHKKSNKKLLEICHKQFVSLVRLREWHELHRQLKETMLGFGYKENSSATSYVNLHSAILTGFIVNIGQKDVVENYYLGTNGRKFLLHPSLQVSPAKWMVAANLVETSRLYARSCAAIEPQWLNGIADHLYKYSYSNQHWDVKRGEVVATKSALLYGLLVSQRKISFGRIDPVLAQEVMIKEGLVADQLAKSYPFMQHNLQVLRALEKMEDKLRTSLLMIDDELYAFYAERLSHEVVDIPTLEAFLASNPEQLKINQTELIARLMSGQPQLELYPDHLLIEGHKLRLKYVFDHDSHEDGLVVFIDVAQLNALDATRFDWLVPGMIRDKISFLIKSLPKSQRLQFNPLNESVTEFLEFANPEQNLCAEFCRYAAQVKKLSLAYPSILALEFPRQLRCHFRVLDHKRVLASGDDLSQIKLELAPHLSQLVVKHSNTHAIPNLLAYIPELASLLQEVTIQRNGRSLIGYTSLMLEKNGNISYGVVAELQQARLGTRRGLIQLVKLQLKDQQKYLLSRKMANFATVSIALRELYSADELSLAISNYILQQAIVQVVEPDKYQYSAEEFEHLVIAARCQVASLNLACTQSLVKLAELYQQLKRNLASAPPLSESILLQLDDLLYPGFLATTKWNFLQHYPRYLQAILLRLSKYTKHADKDHLNEDAINQVYDKWYNYVEELEQKHKVVKSELYDFKYKIEELRISLFAQEIRTLYPVSAKRLLNELQQLYLANLA